VWTGKKGMTGALFGFDGCTARETMQQQLLFEKPSQIN